MTRLARWVRSPWDDKLLLAEIAALSLLFRGVMVWAPFATTQRLAARLAARSRGSTGPRARDAARVGWAADGVGRTLPMVSCLSQALAAHVLLVRAGHEAEIKIGVTRGSDRRFVAHAWVELDGNVIVGDHELDRYVATSGPGRVA